ncbi:MAG: ferritin [Bacteroidota bacterium]|nr:ferritin [Bacteroidota bacterium]
MNKKINDAINKQIAAESYSAFLYLSMAAYCETNNFKGMANWLKVQYQEELTHALKLYQFILDRGGIIELQQLDKPETDFSSPLEVFQKAYEHEQKVTGMINDLYELAKEEKDYAFQEVLHWFIKEQVEEEANSSEIAENLKKVGNDGNGLLLIDQQLASRVFVDETIDTATE